MPTNAPGHGHTRYGRAQALKTLESEHVFNHHMDAQERYHYDSACRWCVEEHFAAKRAGETSGLS